MIFIGFGFLMTFLRKYSFSSVGLNFAVAALSIQWHILIHGLWHHLWAEKTDTKITIDGNSFMLADFAAAVVLITYGALLGKTTPTQLLVLALLEINFMVLNELINTESLRISDMGGSMVVHTFGAYFGLAASWILTPVKTKANRDPLRDNASVYRSDLFAMIGTLFLWIYWPSFTAGPASEVSQERAQINTLLALLGSCLTAYIFSSLMRKDHNGDPCYKFDMVDIQNATLAGGVAIGTACDMDIAPGGALITGCCAGVLSVVGYTVVQPLLEEKLGLYDTCGVHNLHGMPGVLAGIIGGFASMCADGGVLNECVIAAVWPGRYNADCTYTLTVNTDSSTCTFACPMTRSETTQGGYQFLYLLITLCTSIASGLLCGKIVSYLPCPKEYMVDDANWEVPSYEHPFYFDQLSASKLQVGSMEEALFDPEKSATIKSVEPAAKPAAPSVKEDSLLLEHKVDWLLSLAEQEQVARAVPKNKPQVLSWRPVRRPTDQPQSAQAAPSEDQF
jgi:ammonium transporter Rh